MCPSLPSTSTFMQLVRPQDNSSKKSTVVAIHQPDYFPWLGFFHKIYCSDVFVLHDNVEYSKRLFRNRVWIRKNPGSPEKVWITVPLKKHSDFALIKDLKVDNSQQWQRKHLNKLRNVYIKAQFFKEYFPIVEKLLYASGEMESLVEINVHIIKALMNLIGIKSSLSFSSTLPVRGKRSSYNISLVKHFGGNVYLSGSDARNYQDESDFKKSGIALVYQDIYNFLEKNPYEQSQGEFINGLSILDALFNIGPEGIRRLFEDYTRYMAAHVSGCPPE